MHLMIMESMEPFGDRRGDVQASMICSTIANTQRTKKSDKVWGPNDFMPKWDRPPVKEQTVDEQVEMLTLLQEFQNASVKNKALAN